MRLSRASLILLLVQLALVSSIAAKYLYQRWNCPRVWVRTVAYDPEMVMRGRYLRLQLTVNGCGRMPALSAGGEASPWRQNFTGRSGLHELADRVPVQLKVENRQLVAYPLEKKIAGALDLVVLAARGANCNALPLQQPVDFYLPEHLADPSRLQPGQELWIEVTVPPQGPPRPLQLATRTYGLWKPLEIH